MAIEPLASHALKKFKIKSKNWGIYGHGAGAHFVHRFVLHHPEASYTLAIAANLGMVFVNDRPRVAFWFN
jgi:hypothetical protein